MGEKVFPIKSVPDNIAIGGDYYTTQSAMMLGCLTGAMTIKNASRSIQTKYTIEFLEAVGLQIEKDENTIKINRPVEIKPLEDESLEYRGDVFTLALIIGYIAGRNESCILRYSESVNPDLVDIMVEMLNSKGIDIYNEGDTNIVVFRSRPDYPVEILINSNLAVHKNCLLMFGLSSGASVQIREMTTTSNYFELCLERFCDGYKRIDTKTLVETDPVDPRKKIRRPEHEYRRELSLLPHAVVKSGELTAPPDLVTSLGFLTLAAMKKKDYNLPQISINRVSNKFLNFLKSFGADITVRDRKEIDGDTVASVAIKCKTIKSKKFAGEQTGCLIDEIPFMAIMAVLGNGTTIIRGVSEYNELGVRPFEEISSGMEKIKVKCGILEDGLVIEGIKEINGTDFGSFVNHKIALVFTIAAMNGQGHSVFDNLELVKAHYPEFSGIFKM